MFVNVKGEAPPVVVTSRHITCAFEVQFDTVAVELCETVELTYVMGAVGPTKVTVVVWHVASVPHPIEFHCTLYVPDVPGVKLSGEFPQATATFEALNTVTYPVPEAVAVNVYKFPAVNPVKLENSP